MGCGAALPHFDLGNLLELNISQRMRAVVHLPKAATDCTRLRKKYVYI